MTPQQFRKCREEMGLSKAELARRLDITWRMVAYYEAGERSSGRNVEIPKTVRLAMAALRRGILDFDGEAEVLDKNRP